MSMKHIFLQTWQLIILLNFTHTYVLFAANLDDFRSIAKKFIPNKLADQLADMAAQNSMKYRQQLNKNKQSHSEKETEEYTDEEHENIEITTPATIRKIVTTLKKRFTIKDGNEKDIDFDDLVDRVREQLEDKFKTQLKSELKSKSHKKEYSNDYSEESVAHGDNDDPKTSKLNNIVNEVTPKSTTEDSPVYYDDAVAEKGTAAENDGMIFQEADLTKTNDSYEDYVTPNRDKMFESDAEEKTIKPQRVPSENKSRYNVQRQNAVKETAVVTLDEQDYAEHTSGEVKAKTETLVDEPEQKGKPKKLKGTMIPTREFYKMSSPNYYDKIPAVAEKYDFNEPLPEKDREPEDLKYFVNPPALINKKIKLKSN